MFSQGLRIGLGASLIVGVMTASALANDGSGAPTWERHGIRVVAGDGYSKEMKGTSVSGEYMLPTGPDVAGKTGFLCIRGKLMAMTTTDDVSLRENLKQAWMYPNKRFKNPTVLINGEQLETNRWTYLKKRKVAIPHSRKLTRKLYNAAIRQDRVEIDFDGKKKFTALLPKPNAVFADFGADCGLGRNKKT